MLYAGDDGASISNVTTVLATDDDYLIPGTEKALMEGVGGFVRTPTSLKD